MNNLIKIENAKVIKVGEFATGNGNNGPYAIQTVKVEWEYSYVLGQDTKTGKQSAVVVMTGENAVRCRDMVVAGNPYAGVPDMYLNLWIRLWGDFESISKKDGGKFEKANNKVVADYFEICPAVPTVNQPLQ